MRKDDEFPGEPKDDPQQSRRSEEQDGSFESLSDKDLLRLLKERGWSDTRALVGPGTPTPRRDQSEPASSEAERQRTKREALADKGLRQLNVIAPDTAAAREFLSVAAEAIAKKTVLQRLRLALADPELVVIGRKVRRLRGETGDHVRKLLKL